MTGPSRGTSAADLLPSATVRWSPQRKAAVVMAVIAGVLDFDEACRRYDLSAEEFRAWQVAFENFGVAGLWVSRTQRYRQRQRATRSRSSQAGDASSFLGSEYGNGPRCEGQLRAAAPTRLNAQYPPPCHVTGSAPSSQ
jgi:hypothetical protein